MSEFENVLTNDARCAEKNRESTCDFADTVARLSIDLYKKVCPEEVVESTAQTVIASFVLVINDKATVVAFGSGTKFMRSEQVEQDRSIGHKVHDSHAEILARRALLRVFHKEIQSIQEKGGTSRFLLEKGQNGRFRLKKGGTLHLYTSSSPCGNSTIRRWGKGSKEKRMQDFVGRPMAWPQLAHEWIDLHPRKDGMIAASVKRDVDANVPLTLPEGVKKNCFAQGTAMPGCKQGVMERCRCSGMYP